MSGNQNQYLIGLDKTPANFVPLSPLSFLARTAAVYPDHISAVYEDRASLVGNPGALPSAGVVPCQPQHRSRRYRRGDAAEHSGHERGALSPCHSRARC